ncbi:ATP-binding protein [Phototrophicus methaneseepsis]|uniref:ATP-binding protein n=1 Tax=Phototrophicus methaneseepsis TaxID=2710758 RepID=A0A7S8ID84_9CHLR|nr:ATP-binding protein [Phototrophicus methaneseepsis]QPC82305.1 ATP-binding protein [Phototrophicus methaneseepsis]
MTVPTDPNNLEDWFPADRNAPIYATNGHNGAVAQRLGVVVGGSLSRGLAVKLEPGTNVEEMAVGRYVVIYGTQQRYFCMINDIALDSTNPAIQSDPPNIDDPFIRDVFTGNVAYGLITVTPMLVIDADGPKPVKTIPGHFMRVYNATEDDVNNVFGKEGPTNFNVGSPLELEETTINLNLKRLVERSVGVFGKSGTGKSFLTRVLLAGVVARGQGVSLIFDMHNDYGWQITSENGHHVKGLAQLFQSKVSILTLDAESSQRRNAKYDFEIKMGFDEIEPEDIAMLKATMSLSDTMIDAAYSLRKMWGKGWIKRLIEGTAEDMDYISSNTNIGGGTLAALQRRIERFERWHFLVEENEGDSVQKIIELLVNQQKSVVLEFGRYGNQLEAYMLVANYLTRRIHHRYVELMEKSLGDASLEPPQLLITIEEAHKFLEPQVARQTTFGIIAREMRKYKVTLLVIDQRPSAIDEEVMSQIGTRVTALLDNERDINAVLNGISGAAGLREVLARLETKQQAIIMGHAVPMPVVIKPRTYDTAFYEAVTANAITPQESRKSLGSGGRRRI